jgi:hypothetical protein
VPPFVAQDVISGSSGCISGAAFCCEESFSATVGWDAVSGFGSLILTAFVEVLLSSGEDVYRGESAPPSPAPTVRLAVCTAIDFICYNSYLFYFFYFIFLLVLPLCRLLLLCLLL